MSFTATAFEAFLATELGRYAWPFFRIAGLLMVAPVFGSRLVPMRIRLGLSLAVTLAVGPMVMPETSPPLLTSLMAGFVIAHEIVLGIAIGFTLQMIFDAVVIGGQTIAMSMGLGFAMMVDPQRGISVPVLSQFFVIMGMLIFLALGGHLALIRMLVDSFELLPIGETLGSDGLWTLLAWGTQMFAGAVRVAIPAVAALLVVNIAFGVMSRAAPTLNLFAIGFPTTMLLGFLVLLFNIGAFPSVFSELMQSAFENVARMLIS
jgi:flagellar biosynthetic protein FliR